MNPKYESIQVKLQRANGECLGTDSRRRTRKAAISCGELLKSLDPQKSEWGNPFKLKLKDRQLNKQVERRKACELKHLSNRTKRK